MPESWHRIKSKAETYIYFASTIRSAVFHVVLQYDSVAHSSADSVPPAVMASLRKVIPVACRAFNASANSHSGKKVAVLGAGGGIGQPLGLLMKLNPLVSELSLYDVRGTLGVAADISHVNTPAKVNPLSASPPKH